MLPLNKIPGGGPTDAQASVPFNGMTTVDSARMVLRAAT